MNTSYYFNFLLITAAVLGIVGCSSIGNIQYPAFDEYVSHQTDSAIVYTVYGGWNASANRWTFLKNGTIVIETKTENVQRYHSKFNPKVFKYIIQTFSDFGFFEMKDNYFGIKDCPNIDYNMGYSEIKIILGDKEKCIRYDGSCFILDDQVKLSFLGAFLDYIQNSAK